ncbi:ABC transporter ATP-binding protein [Brevibacillus dissolubilis]|uniref:ABC transporter ATP-binding protein n=1 Tax=Brevibacillus dissolubilis TaxID=1844116 RepID=UPI0011173220|nr:ABC transporter ATP-binding protein [Brevibacillus dissolubilis]
MSETMIQMQNISKRYTLSFEVHRHALEDVTISIHRGEFVAVTGPSGSGKSTFLAIAGLIDTPTSGELTLAGRSMTQADEDERTAFRASTCGFVFQFPSLIPTMTVRENILLPTMLQAQNRPKRWRKEKGAADSGSFSRTAGQAISPDDRADQLLDRVGLLDKQHDLPYRLSGGEQRRVALARALIHHPPLLLADEPTGALDPENAALIMRLFHELNRDGTTIVMVTHDMEIAGQTERMISLKNGLCIRD